MVREYTHLFYKKKVGEIFRVFLEYEINDSGTMVISKVGVYIRSRRVYNIIRIMGNNREVAKEYRQRPDRQQIDYDRSTIKIQCGCGGRFTEKSKTKHERTNKHIKYDVEEQKIKNK